MDFFKEETDLRKPEDSMSYKFEADAPSFEVDFEVVGVIRSFFPHMGLSSREGLSIMYRTSDDNIWYNIGNYALDTPFTINMANFVEEGQLYEILIYGPIIANLIKLQISLPDDSHAEIIKKIPERNVVVVGGPITHGMGTTTTANMFSNIIERKFEANVSHISFNENNYLENVKEFYTNSNPPVADIGIIELDFYSQNELIVENLLEEIITLMKQRCKRIIGWYCIPENRNYKKLIAENTIKDLINNGEIEILDLSFLYDEKYKDLSIYNVWFINDTGNILIYTKLKEVIRRITKWNI